ncbi:MAG: metal ABC transporter solute-binding protein, Zn/Mn family [Chloroflexia bacterium]
MRGARFLFLVFACLAAVSCGSRPVRSGSRLRVIAVETFLADIAQNVAGDRLTVEALLPVGAEPHAYEPTPRDIARVAESDLLIVNGAGLESFLESLLRDAGGHARVVEASVGVPGRTPQAGEASFGGRQDPHFWLDPLRVVRYVENIRDAFTQIDPEGSEVYSRNAETYIGQLRALDDWIRKQVASIPPERRLLVTNHESLGYFAERYGFRIVGTVLPGLSEEASPSAQELAGLVEKIRSAGVRAIFLETGASPALAQQVAAEAGVAVVTQLYTHSLSAPDGPAPTYIAMMRYDVRVIVEALQE